MRQATRGASLVTDAFPYGQHESYRMRQAMRGASFVTDVLPYGTYRAEEYKRGRYRFFVDNGWRYFTDKSINATNRRREVDNLPRELFKRRCNVEATIFQLCYHTRRKKLKYHGKFIVKIWAICRAAWINMTKIASYQAKNAGKYVQKPINNHLLPSIGHICHLVLAIRVISE